MHCIRAGRIPARFPRDALPAFDQLAPGVLSYPPPINLPARPRSSQRRRPDRGENQVRKLGSKAKCAEPQSGKSPGVGVETNSGNFPRNTSPLLLSFQEGESLPTPFPAVWRLPGSPTPEGILHPRSHSPVSVYHPPPSFSRSVGWSALLAPAPLLGAFTRASGERWEVNQPQFPQEICIGAPSPGDAPDPINGALDCADISTYLPRRLLGLAACSVLRDLVRSVPAPRTGICTCKGSVLGVSLFLPCPSALPGSVRVSCIPDGFGARPSKL